MTLLFNDSCLRLLDIFCTDVLPFLFSTTSTDARDNQTSITDDTKVAARCAGEMHDMQTRHSLEIMSQGRMQDFGEGGGGGGGGGGGPTFLVGAAPSHGILPFSLTSNHNQH